ncbi:MAG: hypothetical protein AB9866_10420 [Syntrophobacteraceae bacterium]
MSRKQNISKKGKVVDIALDREESDELQMTVDRLAVQNPDGESFERYLQTLRNAFADRPLLAAALVDKLSRNPNRTGFLTFHALEGIIAASPYRRHIKQSAYRFSQKGFTSEKGESPPQKVVLIQGESRKPAAHFFHVQGTLWLISALIPETVQGGYSLITAFLEDDFGTFNVRTAESTQRMYKDYLLKISVHTLSRKAVEIPVWHAAGIFFEMLGLWTGKESYAELERARDLLRKYRQPDKKPYVYDLMPALEAPEEHFPEIEIERLFEGMDLSWLRFPKEELTPLHEKIKTLESPLLVVPPEVQYERCLEVLHNAADALCPEKTRLLYRRFFEEWAMALKLSSVEQKAEWAWIIAQDLAGTSSLASNPAVFEIMIYSMKHYWPEDLKPAARGPQASQPPERRTESGIILP